MSNIVTIVGFVQALFGVLVFLTKRPKHLSFNFLTIWMALIAVYQGAALLPFQVVDYFKPGIFPIMFLIGPLLYFYVHSLTTEDFKLKRQHLLHLLPFLLVVVHRSTILGVPISSTPDLIENPNYLYNKIYYSLLMISALGYWLFGLKLIVKHRKSMPLYFSNYSNKNTLGWLTFVLSLFLVLFIANFSSFFVNNVLGLAIRSYSTLSLNLTVFTFIMVYFGINQSAIYVKDQPGAESVGQMPYQRIGEGKLVGPIMTDEQIEELSGIVVGYLQEKKPYRNQEYNLQMLADDLGISRHKLSHVINSGQKKNFYKFINEFRVHDVKQMLADAAYDHFSILGIALECGFNSKTSFNRIFKEETGFTPSEFKQHIEIAAK
ncbi:MULTISPECIES: AraC family transcriptional regulator [unclassified Imperialibacter]|uniref:helix-turn-helix domain-containing protein n=1 Tax=unclassified Imperialibacter TaxID=2629706 RepID=UPI001256D11D|nr:MULTISPECIES: helix-turn-helix domain-containing protein [unclassified Imperialibacter]CAD5266027.1 Helix-turn-helix domain-containing protein [Imperialibacter sp. 75]CAD5292499.1 Helix-turn-helix domain-containing protein [Imperialibacter sp. 89]VVT17506.1 Helix-turn-helix domain-containing protein [Imperialibacter sp. EC-SDR9]